MLVAIRSPGDIGNKNVISCSSEEIKYHAMIDDETRPRGR